MAEPSIIHALEIIGAISLVVSLSVGLAAVALDGLDRYRFPRDKRMARG
jgi:hypothetical protein